MTKKTLLWNDLTERVSYTYVDSFLVMSFCGDRNRSFYYMVWQPNGKLFATTMHDLMNETDICKKWYSLVRKAEAIGLTVIEGLADMKPNNDAISIDVIVMESLSDIDVITIDNNEN